MPIHQPGLPFIAAFMSICPLCIVDLPVCRLFTPDNLFKYSIFPSSSLLVKTRGSKGESKQQMTYYSEKYEFHT